MITVKKVIKDSYAERAGILPDDIIISINNNTVNDILDYRFHTVAKTVDLCIHRGPELFNVVIRKPEYDDLGIESDSYLMDKKQSCRNKCIFCFIDQNPRGMRDSIYFKDDDSRLSFLMGNYITLTNMSDEDIDRIIKMRMSPINISVHTTNPELRCKMLGNRFAGSTLRFIKKLADNGIDMNFQIVLCKGVNDKSELERTVSDLVGFYPSVSSIAVVPVGLTKHRDNLFKLEAFDENDCKEVIDLIERKGSENLEKYGARLVYASDEFFLKAGVPLPDEEYYEDYPQIENGVGLITSMRTEFYDCIDSYHDAVKKKFSIATGYAAYDFIKEITGVLTDKFKVLDGRVFRIRNDFYGESVTVSGLICGCDLYEQLKDKDLGDYLFISSSMARNDDLMMLDGVTVPELEEKLKIKIITVDQNGRDFIEKIIN